MSSLSDDDEDDADEMVMWSVFTPVEASKTHCNASLEIYVANVKLKSDMCPKPATYNKKQTDYTQNTWPDFFSQCNLYVRLPLR